MQFGYGKKTKKHKKKAKAKAAKDGADAAMPDAVVADAAQPAQLAQPQEESSAKDKQRRKMELKQALRVRVNTLKSTRSKLTKAKKVVSKESKLGMKAEVKELIKVGARSEVAGICSPRCIRCCCLKRARLAPAPVARPEPHCLGGGGARLTWAAAACPAVQEQLKASKPGSS
jgi:hypothetical protein